MELKLVEMRFEDELVLNLNKMRLKMIWVWGWDEVEWNDRRMNWDGERD